MAQISRRSFVGTVGAVGAVALTPVLQSMVAKANTAAPSGPFQLPPLSYDLSALEPVIDAKTMALHHGKHHAAYVANLNAVLKDHPRLAGLALDTLLEKLNEVPENIRTIVRNNAGGHANHTMFWQIMASPGGPGPEGDVKAAIDRDFGSLSGLQEQFNAAGSKVFGSGWVFVTVDRTGKLALAARANQDTPIMDGERALFGNDVWEHAYYLKYQNRRGDYLKAWWNVIHWPAVAARYAAAQKGQLTI